MAHASPREDRGGGLEATDIWARIDADPPDVVAVLKPDHVRDVDLFHRRCGARAYGPFLFFRDDVPRTEGL